MSTVGIVAGLIILVAIAAIIIGKCIGLQDYPDD